MIRIRTRNGGIYEGANSQFRKFEDFIEYRSGLFKVVKIERHNIASTQKDSVAGKLVIFTVIVFAMTFFIISQTHSFV